MTIETETVLDRRRLRRRVGVWRAVAIVAIVLAVGALLFKEELTGRHIARVVVEGTIVEDREQLKVLKKAAEAESVSAVLVYVNSPGGTTAGGEALFEALREVAKKKPVVAQFGTVAASAGYIVGLGADHIVARGNTITGSVGVIVQWPEVTGLLDKLGIKMNEIKSGELKAVPSPFEPLDERGREVTREMISDSYKWFVSLVEERRAIKISEVPGLAEGRIYSGREAARYRLVDTIGGEDEAVRWLVEQRSIPASLKVIDWKPAEYGWGGPLSSSRVARALLGETGGAIADMLSADPNVARLGLDGLVSVWHPSEK